MKNYIILGDCEQELKNIPNQVDLIFTSPPYYNAKPEYAEYSNYNEYLDQMKRIFIQCKNVLKEGRFFVINISPVLVPRNNRNSQSKRLAIPFDFHNILSNIGFDFIDDIIWEKPEGASIGRGRQFFQTRLPLTYKTNSVTEYILVYRKHSNKLIDYTLSLYDEEVKNKSKVLDNYEKTNIWKINPVTDKVHPAVFPCKLAENIIKYYSFAGDTILDPFSGIGTTAKACIKLNRNFVYIERNKPYLISFGKYLRDNYLLNKLNVFWLGIKPPKLKKSLFGENE